MLSVTCKPYMLSVTCKPYMLSVVMLNADMLSVVAPTFQPKDHGVLHLRALVWH
jgi:hypothetical protein